MRRAEVEHRADRVELRVWVKTGRGRELVTLVITRSAFADLQFVMDCGPKQHQQRSMLEKRKAKSA